MEFSKKSFDKIGEIIIERIQLRSEEIDVYIKEFEAELTKRIAKHGAGLFVSAHEGLGKVDEEHHELSGAISTDDPKLIAGEAMDVAVGAFWMYVSIKHEE